MLLREKLPFFIASIKKGLSILFSSCLAGKIKDAIPKKTVPIYNAGKYKITISGVENATNWRWVAKLYDTDGNAITNLSKADTYLNQWSIGYFNTTGFYVENSDGNTLTRTITIKKPCRVWFLLSYGSGSGCVTANTKAINPKIEEVTA